VVGHHLTSYNKTGDNFRSPQFWRRQSPWPMQLPVGILFVVSTCSSVGSSRFRRWTALPLDSTVAINSIVLATRMQLSSQKLVYMSSKLPSRISSPTQQPQCNISTQQSYWVRS
jgi:hypothetical protein